MEYCIIAVSFMNLEDQNKILQPMMFENYAPITTLHCGPIRRVLSYPIKMKCLTVLVDVRPALNV